MVYGACDPNPSHSRKAGKILEAAGIRVVTGILEEECQDLIRGFSTVQMLGRPWLIAKTAIAAGQVTVCVRVFWLSVLES